MIMWLRPLRRHLQRQRDASHHPFDTSKLKEEKNMPVALTRIMRGAVAVGAAAMILGGVRAPVSSADPLLPLPALCGFSSPGNDSGVEVDAIKTHKATYFSNIDSKNWTGLRDLL